MKPYANGFIFCVDMEYLSKMLSFLSKKSECEYANTTQIYCFEIAK